MSAGDHLSGHQFFDVPNVYLHESIDNDPQYWNGAKHKSLSERTSMRVLQPEHPLHTAQDFLHPREDNVYVNDPAVNGAPYTDRGALPDHPRLPHVAHIPGVGDVIGHGHHRIAAARYRGEPVPVMYTVQDP